MDIKEFNKHVKNGCHFIAPPNLRKECMDTMMCNWNKCQREQQDLASARFTDADLEFCKNKDFNKEFNCEQKLTKKKGLMDKSSALLHCTANKCPKIRNLYKKASRELTKRMHLKKNSSMVQREKCMKEHCSKEEKERDKQFELFDKNAYECEQKYETYKEQLKCNRKTEKQTTKSSLNAMDCKEKHCPWQPKNKKNIKKPKKPKVP